MQKRTVTHKLTVLHQKDANLQWGQNNSEVWLVCLFVTEEILYIPNGCLDAYEVKVNIDICKYQDKVKPRN